MPKPRKDESRNDWMERCVPFVMKENNNKTQSIVICSSMYDDKTKGIAESEYGRCPKCGSAGALRERRINGDDICMNGHKYASASAIEVKDED